MTTAAYWLDLFAFETWQEYLAAGGKVSGFREGKRKVVQQIKKGDFLVCYLTGVSRWIGLLEVTGEMYEDKSPIWHGADFSCRLHVRPTITLTPETALPVGQFRNQLSFLKGMGTNLGWTAFFRSSPHKIKPPDAEILVEALKNAAANPVVSPVNPAKLKRRPSIFRAKIGPVTIPESEQEQPPASSAPATETSAHTEIQMLLLRLGSDMGLDVWVARNDRGREVDGKRFADVARLREDLPPQFDEATNRTIELIDVLWLRGNAIVAAFEIESTTSIYSGLLRMSDLVSMQPNLNIPLYLVAPDERRDKVVTEVNRPTFSRLSPPLTRICRYISFSQLRNKLSEAAAFVRYLKPEFLDELSESCEVEPV